MLSNREGLDLCFHRSIFVFIIMIQPLTSPVVLPKRNRALVLYAHVQAHEVHVLAATKQASHFDPGDIE
jgi:hypothetical protein